MRQPSGYAHPAAAAVAVHRPRPDPAYAALVAVVDGWGWRGLQQRTIASYSAAAFSSSSWPVLREVADVAVVAVGPLVRRAVGVSAVARARLGTGAEGAHHGLDVFAWEGRGVVASLGVAQPARRHEAAARMDREEPAERIVGAVGARYWVHFEWKLLGLGASSGCLIGYL